MRTFGSFKEKQAVWRGGASGWSQQTSRLFPLVEIAHKGAREAVRVEIAQIFQAFADADFEHGKIQLVAHGQRNAAFGSAVELGDDDAVQAQGAVELARLRKAVLAAGRIDYEHR